jgi:hypothetical protein
VEAKGRSALIQTIFVHPRHLGSLATDERAPSLTASLCDALYNLRRHGNVELAAPVVVEKIQRFRSLHQQVVDRHGDEVDA